MRCPVDGCERETEDSVILLLHMLSCHYEFLMVLSTLLPREAQEHINNVNTYAEDINYLDILSLQDTSASLQELEDMFFILPPPIPLEEALPLDIDAIAPIIVNTSQESQDNECPICLKTHSSETIVRKISACNHTYCDHCITRWLTLSATCPVCRAQILSISASSA